MISIFKRARRRSALLQRIPTALTQRASSSMLQCPTCMKVSSEMCAAHAHERWTRHRLALNDPGSRKFGVAGRPLAPLPGVRYENALCAVSSAGVFARPPLDTRRRRHANATLWSRYARLGRTIRCVARCITSTDARLLLLRGTFVSATTIHRGPPAATLHGAEVLGRILVRACRQRQPEKPRVLRGFSRQMPSATRKWERQPPRRRPKSSALRTP